MNLIDLFIILIYFILTAFGPYGINALSLAVLTGVIILVRLAKGERA